MSRPASIPSHVVVPVLLTAGAVGYGIHALAERSFIRVNSWYEWYAMVGGSGLAVLVVGCALARWRVARALKALMDDTPLRMYREVGHMSDEAATVETALLRSLSTIVANDSLGNPAHRLLHFASTPTLNRLPKTAAVMVATSFLANLSRSHPGWGLARKHRFLGFKPTRFTLLLLRERVDNEKEFAGIAVEFNQSREEITVTTESHAIRPSPWKIFFIDFLFGALSAASQSGQTRGYRYSAEKTCAMMIPEVHLALENVVRGNRPRIA